MEQVAAIFEKKLNEEFTIKYKGKCYKAYFKKSGNEHIKYAFIIGFEKTLDKADLQRNKNRKWATI